MSKAKKKGLFAFLLALLASAIVSGTLLLSPATVNAATGESEGNVITVDSGEIAALQTALTRAQTGDMVRLTQNITLDLTAYDPDLMGQEGINGHMVIGSKAELGDYGVNDGVILDLAGHTLAINTNSYYTCLLIQGVDFTVTDSVGGGRLAGTSNGVFATADASSEITLENVTVEYTYGTEGYFAGRTSDEAAIVTDGALTLDNVDFALAGVSNTATTSSGEAVEGAVESVAKVGDTYYSDVKTAIESATEGQTVELTDNAAISEVVFVYAANVTLNLGEYTLTIPENFQDKLYDDQGEEKGAGVAIRVYGSLTLAGGENGRIDATKAPETTNPLAAQPGGVITVNSGTIEVDTNSEACIFAFQGGKVIINGGSLINRATGEYTWGGEEVLVVNAASNATTPANTMVQVNGGTFIGRNPAFGDDAIGGTFITEEVKTVTYTLDGQTYVMVYDAETEPSLPAGADAIGGDYFEGETLVNEVNSAAALSSVLDNVADEAYIRLGASFAADVVIPEGKTVTLDLNGKTLTNVNGHTILNYGTLIITDTLGGGTVDNVTHARAAVYNEYGGDVTILDGTFRRSAEASTSYTNNGGNSYYVIANEGDMVIGSADEDCNIIVYTGDSHEASMHTHMYSALVNTLTYDSSQESHLTIYDGEFYGGNIAIKGDTWSTLAIRGGTISAGNQAVQTWEETLIDGGEFNGRVVGWMDENGNRATLTIESGTFNGALETLLLGNDGNAYNTDEIETSVSGGEFANAIPESYIAENSLLYPEGEGYKVEEYSDALLESVLSGNENYVSMGNKVFETAAAAAEEGAVAVTGQVAYANLQDAIDAAEAGATVTLIGNVTLNNSVNIEKNITIDGNKFEVKLVKGESSADLHVFDIVKSGITVNFEDITISSQEAPYTQGVQQHVQLITVNTGCANATVNVTGSTLTAPYGYAMITFSLHTNFNVKDSEVNAWGIMYFKEDAELSSGTITGSEINATYSEYGSGQFSAFMIEGASRVNTKVENSTIVLDSQGRAMYKVVFDYLVPTPGKAEFVNTDITLKGSNTSLTNNANATLAGGSINDPDLDEKYIADGYVMIEKDGVLNVYTHDEAAEADMTAVIGKVAYESLYDAVANVKDGETITVLDDDLEANGIVVPSGSNFTIDFNGHTYVATKNLAGSSGTETQVFQLLAGSTIVMKNGTLRGGVSSVRVIIQNYADLTLENMTLDAVNSPNANCEALGVNNGNVVIKGATELNARDTYYAFDVYYWPTGGYPDGATVTFDETFTGEVNGIILYSGDNADMDKKLSVTINGNGLFDVTISAPKTANITANSGNFVNLLPIEYVGKYSAVYTDNNGAYTVATSAPEGMEKVAVLMDGEGYATIAEAIAAAQGDEIELSLYDDLVENVVIREGKTVILDLAGFTITNVSDHTIVNYGNLTIKDSSEQKSGVVDNITHARAAVYNEVGGVFVLDGARLARSLENGASSSDNGGNSYYVLLNHGTATLNGYISQDGAYSSLIENGWYNGSENTTGAASVMNIIGGEYSGGLNTVKNDDYGVLTISAGTFSNVEQSAVLNWNEATISGGTFQVNSNYAVVLNGYLNDTMDKGELTITGGSFHGQTMIAQMGGSQSIGEVAISGGEFSNMPKAAYFAEGFVADCDDFGIYKVKKGTFAIEVGEYKFVGNDLRQAILFAKDGETVKLLGDIKTTMTSATVKSEITIDLNGKTITAAQDMLFILNLKAEKDITIKNGSLSGKNGSLSGKAINVVAAADDVHINISGITVERLNDKYPEESDNQYKGVTPPVLVIGSSSAEYITNATLEDVHINVYVNASASSAKKAVEIYNANVTIKDSYIFADSKEGITINGVAIENSDVTVTGSEIVSTTGSAMGFLGALSFEGAVAGDAENFNTLTVENSMLTGYTIALSGDGGEGNSGTVINVIDSQLNSTGKIGPAIYHPQYGIINISGDKTVLKGSSGIEIRAGIANISGGEFTANAETFSAVASGNGTTTDGAAVAVVQHTTKLPVQVNITGGTFNTETESGKTLYQADLQNNGEEAVAKIAMDVSGGEFNGAVESKNVKGFITGGRFAELPAEDAFAEGLAGELYDGYYMVVNAEDVNAAASIADRLSAQSDLRAYLASFGLTITDMQLVAESDELAADIVAAYDEIFAASTKEGVAEALTAAMDAVDAYKLGLDIEKAAALTELTEYAMGAQGGDLAIVVVPTYAISAINAAVTADEIETYVSLAKAEMDDIRAQRAEAEQQYQAVNDRFDAIMQALGITGSAEEGYTSEVLDKLNGVIEALGITEADGAWSTDLLDGITRDLETANENIAAMQDLLGTAADEATAQTIIGMIKATQNSVAAAESNITQLISELSSDISGRFTTLTDAVNALPTNETVEALTERLAALEGTVSGLDTTVGDLGTDIGELETAVAGLTTAQDELTQAINGYKTAVDGILTDMTGKFEEISAKLDDLPTNDELATALTNALSGVTEQLTAIKAEVDKIDGMDDTIIGSVSDKIDAAFASFTQTFNTAMNGINTKLDSLDSAIAALPDDADITALKEAVQAATDAAKEAGTKVDTLGTTLSGGLDSVDSAITSIDDAIDGLTAAQNVMNEAMTAFRSELNTTLSGVNEAIAAVKADVKALADTAAADKVELLDKLTALQTSADAIEQAIASLDGDSSADLSAISAELAALQTSLGDVADVVDEVALGNTNSSSSFAGIYVYLSAILVLAAVILIVLAVKKRR